MKKNNKYIVVAIVCFYGVNVEAQIGQVENSPIYYNNGKVGIGISNPHDLFSFYSSTIAPVNISFQHSPSTRLLDEYK